MTQKPNNTGVFVDQGLLRKLGPLSRIPRQVSDFLLNTKVDPDNPSPGVSDTQALIKNHCFGVDRQEWVKSEIAKRGRFMIIDRVTVKYDADNNVYLATVQAMGGNQLRLHRGVMERFGDTLLKDGMYGEIEIIYDPNYRLGTKKYPFGIVSLTPCQLVETELSSFYGHRRRCDTNTWIDLLIHTTGLDPDTMSPRVKLLYLVRLVPFVQPATHLIELGPTETAKTFFYRNLSPFGHVISGSNITVARLFYNKASREIGVVGTKDVVCFDEISTDHVRIPTEVINILKDAMNAGEFSRDDVSFRTDASICWTGNLDPAYLRPGSVLTTVYLFSNLPAAISKDRAFVDRFTGFIPGWALPKIADLNYSGGTGFMASYFSSIMHQLRQESFDDFVNRHVDFGDMSHRNSMAITKILCGLLKLIHPCCRNSEPTPQELETCLLLATELRQGVVDQLSRLSEQEFGDIRLQPALRRMQLPSCEIGGSHADRT